MKPCPSCGRELADEVTACEFCHASLSTLPEPGEPTPIIISGKAIASLILAVQFPAIVVMGVYALPPELRPDVWKPHLFALVTAAAAVVLGHWSRRRIRRSDGRLKGQGMALAGLILGYCGCATLVLGIIIPDLLRSRITCCQSPQVGALRTLNTAQITYASTYGGYSPSLSELQPPPRGKEPSAEAAGLVDEVLASGAKRGYIYIYIPGKKDSEGRINEYSIYASPIRPGVTGVNYYYTDQTGVIRQASDRQASASDSPIAG